MASIIILVGILLVAIIGYFYFKKIEKKSHKIT